MKHRRFIWMSLMVLMGLYSTLWAAPATLAIGSPAPDFNLRGFVIGQVAGSEPNILERQYTFRDFAEAKVLVLIFTCNHCPTAQAYEQRIMALAHDYRDQGVAVVCISANDPLAVRLDEQSWTDLDDTYEQTKARALERGFDFPYLYDGDKQEAGQAYGPAATPHVFIFDQARMLRYTGRIDDSENPEKVTQHETRDAIEALLAGRTPAVDKTRTFGCSIKWSDKRQSVREALDKWNQEPVSLETVDAEAIKIIAQNQTDKLRLINVWATWCGPCVIEFPELVTINRIYRNREFEMITINLDDPNLRDKALAFLKKQVASCRNTMYAEANKDLLAQALDPEWPGVIPYTLLIAPGGEIIYRCPGMIDSLDVKKAIIGYLGRYFFKPSTTSP